MPNSVQRSMEGRRSYAAGSAIQQRNAALARAKRIGAVRASNPAAAKFVGLERVVTAVEYCNDDPKCRVQADKGREPFLLFPDEFNPGEFLPLAVYTAFIDGFEERTGLCKIDVHAGPALVAGDTLIYWK